MGLDVSIKGLGYKDTYHGGYITFGVYRKEVAKAYNDRIGELYAKTYIEDLTNDEIKEWNELCNDDLDIFLWHSDCDGKFTPKECNKIHNVLKNLKIDMQGHNYGTMNKYEMHELWLNMFKYCYKRRVNMYFG